VKATAFLQRRVPAGAEGSTVAENDALYFAILNNPMRPRRASPKAQSDPQYTSSPVRDMG